MLTSSQIALLENRDFVKVFIGMLVSSIGDWFRIITASYIIYETTKPGILIGTLWITITIPLIIFGPFGVVVDRLNKKKLMIFSDVICAFLVMSIALLSSGVWLKGGVKNANRVNHCTSYRM